MAKAVEELRLTDEQLAAFAGPNSEDYLKFLAKCRENGRFRLGFVWGAFLAPPVWLAYRRLYLYLAFYLIAVIALAFLMPDSSSAGTAGSLAVAMTGKMLIVQRAWKAVDKSYDVEMNDEQRLEYLARKGGVSWTAGGIVLFLYLLVVALAIAAVFIDPQQATGA
jgi:hypothetical protein